MQLSTQVYNFQSFRLAHPYAKTIEEQFHKSLVFIKNITFELKVVLNAIFIPKFNNFILIMLMTETNLLAFKLIQ